MITVTRFAPSPTGYLHVGSARTALFCWIFARAKGGRFILRVEDTDRSRSTDAAVETILKGLDWLGLEYDGEPEYQTKRLAHYKAAIAKLEATGQAYRCYCSKERLDQLRDDQMQQKQKPKYDGHCRDHTPADPTLPYVIRFKNPTTGCVEITDLVRGKVVVQNTELDDLIIQRSDGMPTYNLTVVVDDSEMGITHVIRGEDHLNNTPRQINILKALNASIPAYAHIPMILGEDGKKLSKRHGAVSVLEYRDTGILPQALINYLVRLGWSHGDQEIFTIEEIKHFFELTQVNRSAAAFDIEKLLWLNQHYLKTLPLKDLMPEVKRQFIKLGLDLNQCLEPKLEEVILLQRERVKTTKALAEQSLYFYQPVLVSDYDPKAAKKHLKAEILAPLQAFQKQVKQLEPSAWKADRLHQIILEVAEASGLKLGKFAQPVRVAMTGGTVSPSLDRTLALIGREPVLQRLDQAIHFIEEQAAASRKM